MDVEMTQLSTAPKISMLFSLIFFLPMSVSDLCQDSRLLVKRDLISVPIPANTFSCIVRNLRVSSAHIHNLDLEPWTLDPGPCPASLFRPVPTRLACPGLGEKSTSRMLKLRRVFPRTSILLIYSSTRRLIKSLRGLCSSRIEYGLPC